MIATTPSTSSVQSTIPSRGITHRTFGHRGGPITRLMSPGDLGRVVKPFVFLDLFDAEARAGEFPSIDMGWHPHSGIATVTVMLDGSSQFAETTGRVGTLPAGGVEFMQAGGGVWHTGTPEAGRVRGFQLWVALPPDLENGPNASFYANPEQVPSEGPARVILGSYGAARSPIPAPPMTYLSVSLRKGERWRFVPPAGHDVAWAALMNGSLGGESRVAAGELVIFEEGGTPIEFVAEADSRFVLGSAAKHPHELVLGSYSVHTTRAALVRGEEEIRRIGRTLRAEGKMSYALRSFG